MLRIYEVLALSCGLEYPKNQKIPLRKGFLLSQKESWQTGICLFMNYSKIDAQTVIKASYTPCPIIKDKVEQFLIFNLQKQKITPIPMVINI